MESAISQWNEHISVFDALRTDWNDKLDVIDGRLQLQKGKDYRKMGTPIVVQPTPLADQIEKLISNTAKECFESLKRSRTDDHAFYEKVASFKRQCKCLCTSLSNLQYAFRAHDIGDKSNTERYSQLYTLAANFLKEVEEFKSILVKPPQSSRPIKHIDYDERTTLQSIKRNHPKRVPLSETVAAAKKALSFAQPKVEHPLYIKRIIAVWTGLQLAIPVFFAGILTLLKIVFWNPVEWLKYGEVRTQSPLRIVLEQTQRPQSQHMRAYQRYTTQLLHCPQITPDVADAFEQLAPNAYVLDIGSEY